MEIGRIISKLRTEQQLNQRDFASLLGVSNGAVGMWETGKRQPDLDTINKIADFFGESTDYLLGRTEQRQSSVSTSSQDTIVLQRLKELLEEEPGVDFYSNVSHIPVNILYQYANGELSPNAYDLCKIVETLNTSADYLFGKSNTSHPSEPQHEIYSRDGFPSILEREMDGNYLETELADKLNVPISYIKKMLSGKEQPSADILFMLAQIFEKSTDYLLGFSKKSKESYYDGTFPFEMNPTALKRIQTLLENNLDEYTAEELGLNTEELLSFYNYGFLTHISVLIKLCQEHSLSADYLLGLSDSKLSIISQKDNDEESLLKLLRKLDEPYRKKVEGFIADQVLQQERDFYMRSSVAADDALVKAGKDNMGKSLPSNGTEGGTKVG